MVPKLHAKGSSFKGAAAYLLHDKGADTSERVAWAEVRNLAVDDPDLGWRIMAATAMDQERLKSQAGVKNTGRKSDKHVLHLTLSWHPEQRPSREDMAQAADGAIAALKAEDRQAMLIAHDDEAHAHVHILINRVSPEDGRHLSSSKEKLALSQWAQAYEQETGIYCENRIINNAERDKGDYVRGEKERPRHLYELEAANDNRYSRTILADQKAKDAALAVRGREMALEQRKALESLQAAHQTRKADIAAQRQKQAAQAKENVREAFRPRLVALNQQQRKDAALFSEMEKTFFGRARNTIKAMELARHVRGEDSSGIIKRSFRVVANAGARLEAFEKGQDAQRKALGREQAQAYRQEVAALKAAEAEQQRDNRARFMVEREALVRGQAIERDQIKADWAKRNDERKAIWERYRALAPSPARAKPEFDAATGKAGSERDQAKEAFKQRLVDRYIRAARTGAPAREQDNNRDRGDRER